MPTLAPPIHEFGHLEAILRLHGAFVEAASPADDLLPSQWAEKYRIVSAESTGRTMPWKNDLAPYMVEPMDTFHPSCPSEMTVVMKPVQVTASEAMNTMMGWICQQEKQSLLMLQPTIEVMETYSDLRIKTMIRDSPKLAAIISEKSRDETNRKLLKTFPGGFMKMGGANSAASLRSLPVPYLLCDEVDGWPEDCEGEGAPLALASKRTDRFPDHKIWLSSTPTFTETSVIEAHYQKSSQGTYHVPCLLCGAFQSLEWEMLVYKNREHHPAYECRFCNGLIDESSKYEMLVHGHWVHQFPDNWKIRGFLLNGLYSPVGFFNTWANMVNEYLEAQAEIRLKKKKTAWVAFQNTRLARTVSLEDIEDEEPDVTEIQGRCEVYPDKLPNGIKLLTCAVDTQRNRLEYEIMGWGAGKENWSWQWGVLEGSPGATTTPNVWNTLDLVLAQTFERQDGTVLSLARICIDTGGENTDEVYQYARKQRRLGVVGTKGWNVHGKPLLTVGHDKHKRQLWLIGTETAKDTVFTHLGIADPGPGYCHFPRRPEYDDEFFKQIFSEEPKTVMREGHRVRKYVPRRKRNEKLDLRVMNYAAVAMVDPTGQLLAALEVEPPKKSNQFRRIISRGTAH